jgi:pyrroline-5-carboxylate reductase
MKKYKVGLVDIGKLGTALMTYWNKNKVEIGAFHPEKTKAEKFVQQFQNGYLLAESELKELDVLILALPAMEVIPFITTLKIQTASHHSPYLINMATALHTNEITEKFPSLNVLGVKYIWAIGKTYWNMEMAFSSQKPLYLSK